MHKEPEATPRRGTCRTIDGQQYVWDGTQWLPILKQSECCQLPDGSGFMIASMALPQDHWLYQTDDVLCDPPPAVQLLAGDGDNGYTPMTRRDARQRVMKAIQWAVRGATMNGKVTDWDPDAVVQNAVYALLGPVDHVGQAIETPEDSDR